MSENDLNADVTPFPVRAIPEITPAAVAAELAKPDEEVPSETASALPPPAGLSILAAMASEEEVVSVTGAKSDEAPSAEASYGYDKIIAEEGKWVPWPKLGPDARLFLAKTQNKAWKTKLNRLRKKFGDDNGAIDPAEFTDRLLGPLMVESVFLGMENVIVKVGQPPLTNNRDNRLALFETFDGLKDEVLVYCSNPKNFRDNSEGVIKNS